MHRQYNYVTYREVGTVGAVGPTAELSVLLSRDPRLQAVHIPTMALPAGLRPMQAIARGRLLILGTTHKTQVKPLSKNNSKYVTYSCTVSLQRKRHYSHASVACCRPLGNIDGAVVTCGRRAVARPHAQGEKAVLSTTTHSIGFSSPFRSLSPHVARDTPANSGVSSARSESGTCNAATHHSAPRLSTHPQLIEQNHPLPL